MLNIWIDGIHETYTLTIGSEENEQFECVTVMINKQAYDKLMKKCNTKDSKALGFKILSIKERE